MDAQLFKQLTESDLSSIRTEELIQRALTEAALAQMPMLQLIPMRAVADSPFFFRRRTALPVAVPQGPSSDTVRTKSSLDKVSVALKTIREAGGVDNFSRHTISDVELLTEEALGCAISVVYQLAGMILWGDATANSYTFDGFDADPEIVRHDGGNDVLTKSDIDSLIDAVSVSVEGAQNHVLVMSKEMLTRLTDAVESSNAIRYDVEIEPGGLPGARAGLRLHQYRGIPIYQTEATRPKKKATGITASVAAGQGSLAAGTYYYRLAPVTRFGEQGACDTITVNVSGDNSAVNFSVPAFFIDSDLGQYTDAWYWKIYRGTSSGDEVLVNVANGLTYDASGTPTAAATTVTDDGDDLSSSDRGGATTDTPLTYSSSAPDECIFIIDTNRLNGCELGYKDQRQTDDARAMGPDGLLGWLELAQTRDRLEFMVRAYAALGIKQGRVHGVLRGVRASSGGY